MGHPVMKKLYAALFLGLVAGIISPAQAQTVVVVSSCGTLTLAPGYSRPLYEDTTGTLCTASGGGAGSNVTVVGPVGSQASTVGVSVTIASDQAAVAVKQASAANLNATVVGTGTLAVQNTSATPAGSAIIGKFGIDQTTPGTTNAVQTLTGSTTAVTQATASSLNATVVQGTAAAVTGGWPTINGEPADATGTFTNATQTGNVTTAGIDGYGTALITINGTYGTATATFLASDDSGATFYPIACSRTDGSSISEIGYTSLTNTNRAWLCPAQGFDIVRVLSSAVASGTVNVRVSQTAAPTTAAVVQSISGPVQSTVTPSATVGVTTQSCTVACASTIVSGAHALYGISGSATVTGTVFVYDATSCSANGTVTPKKAYPYTVANAPFSVSWGDIPLINATGLAVCFSSTGPFTATASTTAFLSVDYK